MSIISGLTRDSLEENPLLVAWEPATSVGGAENAGDSTILARTMHRMKRREEKEERGRKNEMKRERERDWGRGRETSRGVQI